MASTAVAVIQVDLWTVAAAIICACICARVLTWRAHDNQKTDLVASAIAWLMVFATGGFALQVLLAPLHGNIVPAQSPALVVVLAIVLIQLLRARGNVASFLRVDWSTTPWRGRDRRKAKG